MTADEALADRARMMRNFGFVDYDDVRYIGTNGKMAEVAAAMGLTSLESMAEFTEANRRNYHLYRTLLADLPGITLLPYDESEQPQLPVHRAGDRGERRGTEPRPPPADPPQRERARAALLLSRLPSHGALSVGGSRGRV